MSTITKSKKKTTVTSATTFQDERYTHLYVVWPTGTRKLILCEKPTGGQPAIELFTTTIRGRGTPDWKRAHEAVEEIFASLPFQFTEPGDE